MSFEISCHLRFHLVWSASVNLNLFQISIEWFRTLKPISGWVGWVGWMGWLSLYDGLLRAPTVLINEASCNGVRPLTQDLRPVRRTFTQPLSLAHFCSHETSPPLLASRNLPTCEGAVTALLWCSASSALGSLFVSGGIPFVSRDARGYCC